MVVFESILNVRQQLGCVLCNEKIPLGSAYYKSNDSFISYHGVENWNKRHSSSGKFHEYSYTPMQKIILLVLTSK